MIEQRLKYSRITSSMPAQSRLQMPMNEYTSLCVQAWKAITSRIEGAMRQLERESPANKSQLPNVDKDGESLREVAPKLPSKSE